MRAALALMIVPLVGCSQILGIEDPSGDDGGGRPDAGGGPTDAPPSGDHLELSVPNFTIAKGQRVRFQVLRVPPSGQKSDVSGDTTLSLTLDGDAIGTLGKDDTARLFDATTTGTATLRASLSGVAPVSILVGVSTFTCHPVINELQTGSAASASDEFVEIFNPCATPQLVNNWTLNYRAAGNVGADDELNPKIMLTDMMAVGEIRLYANVLYTAITTTPTATWANGGLADKGGSVGLRDTNGKIVDSVGYGTAANPFVEGTVAAAPPAGQSLGRGPFDGRDNSVGGAIDGDNKTNFSVATAPSPGALNF